MYASAIVNLGRPKPKLADKQNLTSWYTTIFTSLKNNMNANANRQQNKIVRTKEQVAY